MIMDTISYNIWILKNIYSKYGNVLKKLFTSFRI